MAQIVLALPPDPISTPEFCNGVNRYRVRGLPWLLYNVTNNGPGLVEWVQYIQCKGALLLSGSKQGYQNAERLNEMGVKVVVAHNPDIPRAFPIHRIGRVEIDDYRVGCMGAEHLMSQGFSRLAFFGWTTGWCMERLRGFRNTVWKAGRHCEE